MPYLDLAPDFKPYYEIHDHTDPWTKPETIIFVHGFTENLTAFNAWIPAMSRKYRLILFDIRGFGRTAAVDEHFKFSTELYVDDLVRIINHLAGEAVHVIGGKSGCISAMRLAATRPDLVKTLTLGAPPLKAPGSAEWLPFMETHGIRGWARHTMGGRLGPVPPRCVDWWVEMMGATAMSTAKAYLKWVGHVEPAKDLPGIKAPTLAIMTESSNLADNAAGQVDHNVMRQGAPHAELLLLKMDCYHPAGAHPDLCAQATLEFMARHA
ncbi:MAG TPA: alpha/beta hydrolase [Burkholderiales bacterium]|jgi:pimeloyl-ACP methyl ester carboxylesterase|nr:alpha/beta hydrolase [Burkholderiales bacterium]